MNRSCAIVIPCYNEANRFPLDVFTAYAESHPSITFILVNDGSRDRTIDVLQRAAVGREEQVRVIDLQPNSGKAEAVRRGLLAAFDAGYALAGFWDADLATPLEQIEDLAGVLEARSELSMVFGARVKLLGRRVERRASRHYLGRVFATVVSVVLRLPVYDTQCGAKVFRASPEMRPLFERQFSSRWVFDVEIIARYIQRCRYDMAKVEASIYEYPLPEWRDIAGSRLRFTDFFRAFFDVLGIYLEYRPS